MYLHTHTHTHTQQKYSMDLFQETLKDQTQPEQRIEHTEMNGWSYVLMSTFEKKLLTYKKQRKYIK